MNYQKKAIGPIINTLGGLNYGYYTNFNYFFNYFLHFNDDSVTFYSVCSDFGEKFRKTNTHRTIYASRPALNEKFGDSDDVFDEINQEQQDENEESV